MHYYRWQRQRQRQHKLCSATHPAPAPHLTPQPRRICRFSGLQAGSAPRPAPAPQPSAPRPCLQAAGRAAHCTQPPPTRPAPHLQALGGAGRQHGLVVFHVPAPRLQGHPKGIEGHLVGLVVPAGEGARERAEGVWKAGVRGGERGRGGMAVERVAPWAAPKPASARRVEAAARLAPAAWRTRQRSGRSRPTLDGPPCCL